MWSELQAAEKTCLPLESPPMGLCLGMHTSRLISLVSLDPYLVCPLSLFFFAPFALCKLAFV